jgi:archaellum biogenesis ATPase FlaH
LLWALVKFDLFAKEVKEQILKVRVPSDIPYERLFDNIFAKYLVRADLIVVESVQAGMLTELVYGIELKRPSQAQAFMEELRKINYNNKVSLITGYHEVDL